MQRRELLASVAAVVGGSALAGGLSGCGASGDLVRADVRRAAADPERAGETVDVVERFTLDLLARLDTTSNLVCSPLSVLVTMAMVRNGATGATATAMDRALRLPSLEALNAGMNLIDQTLARRSGKRGTGDRRAKVELDVANSVWGQQDYTWQPAFLQTLAADYGTGVYATDFAAHVTAALKAINRWVAHRTHDKITDIATPDVVTADTRLALVNALYVKAPWAEAFVPVGDRPFSIGGARLPVTMIGSSGSSRYLSGAGWQAARVPLLGEELAMTVVRPDSDLDSLLASLRSSGTDGLLRAEPTESVDLTMPTFTISSTVDLKPALTALGLGLAFSDDAEFSGLTTMDRLKLQAVRHMGYLDVNEDGIEAAAATITTAEATSGSVGPDHQLVLDRPFLFLIHDIALALPLLAGVIIDPR